MFTQLACENVISGPEWFSSLPLLQGSFLIPISLACATVQKLEWLYGKSNLLLDPSTRYGNWSRYPLFAQQLRCWFANRIQKNTTAKNTSQPSHWCRWSHSLAASASLVDDRWMASSGIWWMDDATLLVKLDNVTVGKFLFQGPVRFIVLIGRLEVTIRSCACKFSQIFLGSSTVNFSFVVGDFDFHCGC